MPRKARTYRTLSESEDLTRVGMVHGRREPLHSLLPKLRLQKAKERQSQPSPPTVRKAPAVVVDLNMPGFPAVSPAKKRKSLPSNVFPETYKSHVSPFERKIITKEAKVLLEACEELFPGDPIVFHRTSDPLPARLIYDIPQQPLSRPIRPANHRSPARDTLTVLESLLEYDPTTLPKANKAGLEQARAACIQPVQPRRLPPIINTPASLHLPTSLVF